MNFSKYYHLSFFFEGSIALLPAGTLFLVEARRTRYRRLNELQAREGSVSSGYGMQERKSSHHTDI